MLPFYASLNDSDTLAELTSFNRHENVISYPNFMQH